MYAKKRSIRRRNYSRNRHKAGRMGYTDNSVYYDGITYPRETRNGKDMIKVDGKWKEAGDGNFPWEKAAKPKI